MIRAALLRILHLGNMIFLFYFLAKLKEVFIQLYTISVLFIVYSQIQQRTISYMSTAVD